MFRDVKCVYYASLENVVYRTTNISRMTTAFLVRLQIYFRKFVSLFSEFSWSDPKW